MLRFTSNDASGVHLPVEKTDPSFLQVPMEWIWGALLVTILSMLITVYFMLRSFQKMRQQGSSSKLITIVPNLIMMFGMILMGVQWILNYVVLIETDRLFCHGCYFQEFYFYSLGLPIFLIGWLMHIQHYLIKPQGVLRHRYLNWYLNSSIMTLMVLIIMTYFLTPFIRPYIISLSSFLTTFVIFSFIIIILVMARKDLLRTPRSIAVRRLRLKALIMQALIFLLVFVAGLVYAVLLNVKAYYYLNWYGVIILPIVSNRGLLFVVAFNLLIYWTVYPHDAFIIQEGFHDTEVPFFIDDPRKVITFSNGKKLLCTKPQSSARTSLSMQHEEMKDGTTLQQSKKVYLWVSDVLTPWDIQWQVLNARSSSDDPQSTTIYFLPLSLASNSSTRSDSNFSRLMLQEGTLTTLKDYDTPLSPSHWWEELQDALLQAIRHIHYRLKPDESLVVVLEGFMATPSLLILERVRELHPEILECIDSLCLVSPMMPIVQKAFTRRVMGWGRRFLPRGFIYLSIVRWFTSHPVISSKILSYLEKIDKTSLLQFLHSFNDFLHQALPQKKNQVNPFSKLSASISVLLAQSCPFLPKHQRDMLSFFSNQTVIFLQGSHGFLENYSRLVDQIIPSPRPLASSRVLELSRL